MTENETSIPFGSDFQFHVLRDFVIAGMKYFGRTRFLKLVVDATHDQTKQRLKLLKISVAGHIFNIRSEWVNAEIPVMHDGISQESIGCVSPCVKSFVKMCWDIVGLQIEDYVEDWYLDGNQALWSVFSGMFSHGRWHMCLEHATQLSSFSILR